MSSRIGFLQLCVYGYFDATADITGGGAERQLYLLSQELKSDFDVRFIVGDYGQPATQRREGITLHRAYRPSPNSGPGGRVQQVARLAAAMRASGVDLFVIRGSPRKAIVSYVIARALGAKWVYNVANDHHVEADTWTGKDLSRRVFEYVLGAADGIIAQSDYQKHRLATDFGVEATVVPNGYPPAGTIRDRDERSYFLWVGRLDDSQKRPHEFLDLAERLPDWEFRLVGPARDEAYFERLETRMESMNNVRYLGAVDPDEIHDYYREAIALVNTSAHEGFPNTFLEAWRVKTPVISLSVDPGRFVDASLPMCYADGDAETLATLVDALATDRDQWAEAVTVPYDYFESNLTIERVADRYSTVLDKALSP